MADNSDRIAEIKTILQQGASHVTVDGTTVQYDLEALRRELRELELEEHASKRPVASTINLGGF